MSVIKVNRCAVRARRAVMWLLVGAAVASALLPLPAAAAPARPPHGRYDCYYFYRTGGQFFLGYLFITGPSTYRMKPGGNGRYAYRKRRLTFRSGPLGTEYGINRGPHRYSTGTEWTIVLHNHSGYAGECQGPSKR